MPEYRMHVVILAILAVFFRQAVIASPDTWRLEQGQDWKPVSAEDKFLLEVAEIKKLVNTGQTEAVRKAFNKLKSDFPEIAGPDLDLFIKAEILFCEGKFTKAVGTYDKLLADYPESQLTEAALGREFDIATAFLAGHKKTVLGVFKMKGYAEGVKVMERITNRAGLDAPIGVKAAISVAKNYQKRQMFNEAYLKWQEISSQWETGQIGKDALLNMAQCKHAAYNKRDEHKRPIYNASNLVSAKSYYEKFKLLYSEDASEIGIDEILSEISEQQALKQFTIAQYYQKTDNKLSANLYCDMVISNWPSSKAAEMAKEMVTATSVSEEIKK